MNILDHLLQSSGVFVIAGLGVALYALWTIYTYRRLSHIPGPRWTGISNIPHSLAYASGSCCTWYQSANDKHGSLARIGPNSVAASSPELWARLSAARSPYKRTEWFYGGIRVQPGKEDIFSATDEKLHEGKRKRLAPGYSGRETPNLEADIDTNVSALISLIRISYCTSPDQPSKPMDLAQKIPMFTLDVISTVGFGSAFGMLAADGDVNGYMLAMETGVRFNQFLIALGRPVRKFFELSIVNSLGPSAKDGHGFGKMMGIVFEAVDARLRRGNMEKRSDMLSSFIRHGLSGDELKSEVIETIIAGSDTTAAALRGIMLLLLTSQRVFARLRAEVDGAVAAGKAAAAPDIVSKAQTDAFEYLQAVIREGMRIKVPVVCAFPRDIPAGGETWEVDGQQVFLPGGTDVVYSALAMQRDKNIYGDDAESFRPERWLGRDADTLAAMVKVNDLIFGHGKWHCLGKTVAMFELGKVIFELVRNFDWTLDRPEKPWEAHDYSGLMHIENMWVRVQDRS